MSLKARLALRFAIVLPVCGVMMFAPAGSFRYWQGWIFLAVLVVFSSVFTGYFYRHDRKLLERRLENREPRKEQRLFRMVWVPVWLVTLMLPGVDYRFGWSERLLGGVPLWLMAICWLMVAAGWALVFVVMRFNSFASTVVRVEAGQKVISDGPYRMVRHPMYSGFALIILATPVALGSYVALAPAALNVLFLVFRLRDEERLLREELPGYSEYCEKTRFRLIPAVF